MSLLIMYLLIPTLGLAALSEVEEYQTKARFLFQLSKFVTWPAQIFSDKTQQQIKLCILGQDPFRDELAILLAQKTKLNRDLIEIQRLTVFEHPQNCHILFISTSEQQHLKAILLLVRGYPILTVSEINGFAKQGGMVEMAVKDNQVYLYLNYINLVVTDLRADANLLRVAKIVH